MKLRELLADTEVAEIAGDAEVEVAGARLRQPQVRRRERSSSAFRGQRSDGHDFAPAAVERGAAALVVERRSRPAGCPRCGSPMRAPRWRRSRSRFWGDPTARAPGRRGHRHQREDDDRLPDPPRPRGAGTRTGLLGTVKRIVGGVEEEVERTTPEAIDLQAHVPPDARGRRRGLRDGGLLARPGAERTAGVRFAVAVFTNLTQDHLDFHADMEDYFAAKRSCSSSRQSAARPSRAAVAVVNVDDPYGARLAAELARGRRAALTHLLAASGAEGADFRAVDVSFDAAGSQLPLPRSRRRGRGADAAARATSTSRTRWRRSAPATRSACRRAAAAAALASAGRVPGRFEPVDEGQPFAVLVDYAHTPDSLENVLDAARELTEGRLIAVFGCGGDRDREKRPLMGEIAARLWPTCVVTSDNPRSEDPEAIIAEILAGIDRRGAGRGRGRARPPGRDRARVRRARRRATRS